MGGGVGKGEGGVEGRGVPPPASDLRSFGCGEVCC